MIVCMLDKNVSTVSCYLECRVYSSEGGLFDVKF